MHDRPRAQLAAYSLAAIFLLIAAFRLLSGGGPDSPPVSVKTAAPQPSADRDVMTTGHAPARSAAAIYVHVAGAVRSPGLYRLPAGSRVAAALERAGGPLGRAAVSAVNLAAPLSDGQQVLVPARGGAPLAAAGPASGAAGSAAAAAAGGGQISLSTATAEQLETLDGIGPALAARILDYRKAHGGFRSVDELGQVDGIGDKRLAALRQRVRP